MKSLLLATVLLSVGALGAAEEQYDWKPLFDATLSDAEFAPGSWSYDANGSLVANTGDPIWTTGEYENYVLDFEYAMEPGGNGGVFAYISRLERFPEYKFEVQMLDDAFPGFAKEKPNQKSGSIYGRSAATEVVSKKAGEWNHMRLYCRGQKVKVVLNGRTVSDVDFADWKDPLVNPDGSEVPVWHKGFPALSTIPTKGRVGFQGRHGEPIRKGVNAGFAIRHARIAPLKDEGRVVLAENGLALADIVIAAKPTRVAQFAAYELQALLRQATGADFAIVKDSEKPSGRYELRIGDTARSRNRGGDFLFDEWMVDVRADAAEFIGLDQDDREFSLSYNPVRGEKFSLVGMPSLYDDKGSLLAVYRFLEDTVGFRFVDYTIHGTVVPDCRKGLSVPVATRRGRPFMLYRGGSLQYDSQYWTFTNAQAQAEWADLAFGKDFGKARKRAEDRLLHRWRLRRGGCGHFRETNHSVPSMLNLYYYTNSVRFVESRPECFAKGYGEHPSQLCCSSPDAVKMVVDLAREYLDATGVVTKLYGRGRTNGGKRMKWMGDDFVLEPSDADGYCLCPACEAQYERGRGNSAYASTCWFRFVDKVAKELKKTHPKAKIRTLAYAGHLGVPNLDSLEDSIEIHFCPTFSCSPTRAEFRRQMEQMREWHEKFPRNAFGLWLYNCQAMANAKCGGQMGFPNCFAHAAGDCYRLFKRYNAGAGTFYCGQYSVADTYVQWRLACDPEANVDDLLADCYRLYGAAAVPVRKFYELVEDRWTKTPLRFGGTGGSWDWGTLGTPDFVAQLGKLMDEAEALVKDGPEGPRAQVEMLRRGCLDWMKEGLARYTVRQATPVPKLEAVRVSGADGDPAKVDWAKVPVREQNLYFRGGDMETDFASTLRVANDDKFFYMEFSQKITTADLLIVESITCNDEVEVMFAKQKAQPYRCYYNGPSGLIMANSYGEQAGRQNIPAREFGHPWFHAVYKSDISAPDRWTMRWAFPLDWITSEPVKPGETLYMNLASVIGKKANHGYHPRLGIFTLTSGTSVKTTDRMAEIKLAK